MKFFSGFLQGNRRRQLLFAAAVSFLVLGALIYRGYEYVEHDPRFCQSCHIMEEPFQKWSTSPHHLVTCHRCHQQSLAASIHQVWLYVTKRPEKVIHHPDLDHTVCAQCHLSDDPQWKLIGETAGHKVHFEQAGIDCLDCHMGGVHQFLRPVDACGTCHADKTGGAGKKMAFAHCANCHTFLAKKEGLLPERAVCLECHRKITVGKERFSEDAPMSTFDCSTCHKPHEQIRPDNDVCLTCHSDIRTPHHGMNSSTRCSSCHQPHIWRTHAPFPSN